ncbi:hypothetical protein BDY19DRAFT_109840 [Irpex rosettiformis]|uniref:Uncharacterized protein n=1 Tax=Irpex rosettiformis TaxID=378272 RepID=A0ACB8U5G6_9APHY|nr:hypothetical protein BDY19DRAFT_109840 [Irpex rosettiformis]
MYDHSPSPSANPSLENLNNASAVMEDKENDSALPPTPPAKAKQSPSKKLSLGLKKLTALPSLPKRISASIPTPPDHSFVTKGKSKEKNNTSMAAEAAAPTPDIPKVPVWAGPGHVPTRTGSRAPMPFRPHSPNLLHPGSATLNRRASQASLTPSVASSVQSSSKSTHRRSMALSAHPIPSTSRDPELNWLSTAAPPKFSRLSLKADGVVMPVSAKEMRRRSTASLNRTGSVSSMNSTRTSMSRISESGVSSDRERRRRSVTFDLNTLRKLEGNKPVDPRLSNPPASSSTPPPSRPSTPIISQGLSALSEEDDSDIVSPPLPPFFTSSKNGSASSISSSAGTVSEESDITETPSLSRTSSITEDEESGLPNTPPGTITNTGSVGVVSEATKDLHIRATKPVVKTAEAVTVNVVGVCAPGHSRNEGSSGVKSLDCGDGKLGRRRTLKRMWGKVFSGRSSSMPALKV